MAQDARNDLRVDSNGDLLSMATIALDRETELLVRLWLPSLKSTIRAAFADYGPQDHESIQEWLGNPSLDICIVDFDTDPGKALGISALIQHYSPNTAIFAVSGDNTPEVIIQAMRSGCREYLFKPVDREQLTKAVARVGSRQRPRPKRSNTQVLSFIGAKGGCGVTTVATQLGGLLASFCSRKTILLDLHPTLGDAALYLGFTSHKYNSLDLIQNTGRMDSELLQSLVLHHQSGLDVVPAPQDFDSTQRISPEAMANTLAFLRDRYDCILVDLPSRLNDETVGVVSHSEYIYVVTVAEVAALRNVARILNYLDHAQVAADRVRVILNRFEKRSAISEAQIEKVIGRKIFWSVPNEYQQAVKTITGGDPASQISRSELLRNIKGWAEAIGGKPAADDKGPKKRGGLLGILGGVEA